MTFDFELVERAAPLEVVPAGEYLLSDRIGGRQHVGTFAMDRHLVTVERFRRFVDAGGYDDKSWWHPRGWKFVQINELEAPRFWSLPKWKRFVTPTRPVVGVSWYEADAFCRFEGRRLPTEREWEAAARATDGRRYPWGDEWDDERAAVRGRGPRVTWPVGWFRGNVGPFGHFDLIGNVWQWTEDQSQPERGLDSPRIAKGGGWAARIDKNQTDTWNAFDPRDQHSHVGFRTAADVG